MSSRGSELKKRQSLPAYEVGDHIRIRDQKTGSWKEKGIIMDIRKHRGQNSWSYWVESSSTGNTLLKNAKDLRIHYSNVENVYLAGPPMPVHEIPGSVH